jgi:prophage regulatory protein
MSIQKSTTPEERSFLDARAVAHRYGISVATVWSWLDRGLLPQPIRFSFGCSRWRLETLERFEAEREAECAPRTDWEREQRRKRQEAS